MYALKINSVKQIYIKTTLESKHVSTINYRPNTVDCSLDIEK